MCHATLYFVIRLDTQETATSEMDNNEEEELRISGSGVKEIIKEEDEEEAEHSQNSNTSPENQQTCSGQFKTPSTTNTVSFRNYILITQS